MKLASIEKCTGCSACANACPHKAITMLPNAEGFVIPIADVEKCVECHLCERACPIINVRKNDNNTNPGAFALWSQKDRTTSSSGGAFSAFARLIISKGGVVFGAALDKDMTCRHVEVDSINDLEKLRGSKYVQSFIGTAFESVRRKLREGRYVLFCGTPCQIAGLKSFLRKDYDNLLLLDLACHGVPSNKVFKAYLYKISTRFAGQVDGFEFRRRNGWGFAPSISLGGKLIPIYGTDAIYMSAFDKNAIFRKSCYTCPYAQIPRMGDCSLADFWGIGRYGKPFTHDVMKGVSLVLTNNSKGQSYLEQLKDVFVEERDLSEALVENHNIQHSSECFPLRDEVIKAFLNNNISLKEIDERFHLRDRSLKSVVKEYASRYHVFDIVKSVYNKWRTNR